MYLLTKLYKLSNNYKQDKENNLYREQKDSHHVMYPRATVNVKQAK